MKGSLFVIRYPNLFDVMPIRSSVLWWIKFEVPWLRFSIWRIMKSSLSILLQITCRCWPTLTNDQKNLINHERYQKWSGIVQSDFLRQELLIIFQSGIISCWTDKPDQRTIFMKQNHQPLESLFRANYAGLHKSSGRIGHFKLNSISNKMELQNLWETNAFLNIRSLQLCSLKS
jgi:hypothetical protein